MKIGPFINLRKSATIKAGSLDFISKLQQNNSGKMRLFINVFRLGFYSDYY